MLFWKAEYCDSLGRLHLLLSDRETRSALSTLPLQRPGPERAAPVEALILRGVL